MRVISGGGNRDEWSVLQGESLQRAVGVALVRFGLWRYLCLLLSWLALWAGDALDE